ncbi:DUF4190 domain-containing protein [Spirillospora sp. CA-253888]
MSQPPHGPTPGEPGEHPEDQPWRSPGDSGSSPSDPPPSLSKDPDAARSEQQPPYSPYREQQSGHESQSPYGGQQPPQGGSQTPYGQQPYGEQPSYGESQSPYGQQPYGTQPPPSTSPYGGYGNAPYGDQSSYGGAPYGYGSQPASGSTNTMAIASLVCGIVGLFLCGPVSLAAIVLGHMSLGRIKRSGEGGRGLAMGGLILGYIALVIWVILLIAILAGAFAGSDGTY